MRTLSVLSTLAVFILSASPSGRAGDLDYFLPAGATYDPTIPTPQSYFGFAVGDWHVRHDQLLAYLRALDAASDRVHLEEYGVTYEQRTLVLLTITHPSHHARLEDIRREHRAQTETSVPAFPPPAAPPVVLWLGYTIHGNEASGSNAASLVAYHLAAAQGQDVERLLSSTVIILDPCLNPDGYDRFAAWVNGNRGRQPVADPATREHTEPWPSGRGNHYWFDLNRDYVPLVHPESRARMTQYHRWMPHVLLDFHEMGSSSTYFFQPGKASAVHPLIPTENQRLTQKIARRFAETLDSLGSLYYTEEVFDDFFAGKASTYADLSGSVGILFEQASVRGHSQEHPNGIMTFRFAIRNHVASSLTALAAQADMRHEFLAYQRDFFSQAREEARRSTVRAYLFGSRTDPVRARQLAELLSRHTIRVHEIQRRHTAGETVYEPGSAFLVDVRQPHYRLLTTLLEKRKEFRDSIFYDISAWTLPSAYGLSHSLLTSLPENLMGELVGTTSDRRGNYVGPPEPVAYIIPWSQLNAPGVVSRLLRSGVLMRTATVPFAADVDPARLPHQFDYGTIIVPVGVQREKRDTIAAIINDVLHENDIVIYGVNSGLTAEGIDLGSDRIRPLALPRVLLAAGSGVSAGDAGEMWHLLDNKLGLDVTIAEPAQFSRMNLSRYSVLLLPGGSYAQVDSTSVSAIRNWTENGGTVVAQESAVEWLARKKISPVVVRTPRELQQDTTLIRRPFGEMGKSEGAQMVNGVIVEATVDRSHPLGYGIDADRLALCHGTSLVMSAARDPYGTPLSYTSDPVLSGYLSSENTRNLAGSAAVVVAGVGKGRIVHLADNVTFRGFWLGSEKILVNAVFFGSLLRSQPARGDR